MTNFFLYHLTEWWVVLIATFCVQRVRTPVSGPFTCLSSSTYPTKDVGPRFSLSVSDLSGPHKQIIPKTGFFLLWSLHLFHKGVTVQDKEKKMNPKVYVGRSSRSPRSVGSGHQSKRSHLTIHSVTSNETSMISLGFDRPGSHTESKV